MIRKNIIQLVHAVVNAAIKNTSDASYVHTPSKRAVEILIDTKLPYIKARFKTGEIDDWSVPLEACGCITDSEIEQELVRLHQAIVEFLTEEDEEDED